VKNSLWSDASHKLGNGRQAKTWVG
jgi:hypothetical protein